MKTVTLSSGITISYRQAGQGAPLIFLHAFPLSSAMWQRQIDAFAPKFNVICPNFQGIGSISSSSASVSIPQLATQVSLLLEALEIEEKVALCGLSLGGYVALEFVRSYPDQLRALILADTRPDVDTPEGKKARDEMIAFASRNDGRAVVGKMMPKLLAEPTIAEQPEIVAEVEKIAAANSGPALATLVEAMRERRDSTAILSTIQCPTLVIGGTLDVPSPPEIMGQMAQRIPGAKYVRIEGVGHLSNLEAPEAFNQALRDFLDRI